MGDSQETGASLEPVGLDSKYLGAYPNAAIIYYKPGTTSADDGQWELFTLRPDASANRTPGYVRPTSGTRGCGQEISLVWDVAEVSHRTVAFIKVSLGGTSLLADWQPNQTMYTGFLNFLRVAFNRLGQYGKIRFVAAEVRLGTNDCVTGTWNNTNYIAAQINFVTALRRDTGNPQLPIYWMRVKSDLASAPSGIYTAPNVAACITAQNNMDENSGHGNAIPGVTIINDDAGALQADGVHWTNTAYLAQGSALAPLFLSHQ